MNAALTGSDIQFRRNDNDRREPRLVLTALLMGDPLPDRVERSEALRAKIKPPKEPVDCPARGLS